MARTLRAVPVSLIWLTLLFLSQGCNALITPTDHDCSGVKRLHSSGVELLDATACSTNRALGYAIGKQFRKSIVERVSKLGPQLVKAVAYTKSEEGEAAVAQLVNTSADAYPQYWQELEGIAEGSGLPKELIVLLNFRQELSILAANGSDTDGADDCSDVMLHEPKTAFLGHNEDNTADNVGTTYFVQAKLNGRAFTAYTYAGELSTAAWGFNDAGVSFTLNAVYAKEVKLPGVGRNFVSRSILDAPSFEEAIKRITVPNQATGHNINVIGLDTKSIATIETGPGSATDVKSIRNTSYFHANAYLRLDVPHVPGASSIHRQRRAAELWAPQSREDILAILGDTEDPKYPIWRSGTDDIYTLCTAFFDLQAETVEIFFDNPQQGLAADSLRLALRAASPFAVA